jgi:2-amino-4-hydroxy-6-hydroxymethyldihydropteridine diphosphokinase
MTPHRTGIALGSNLGDRTRHLQLAVRALLDLHAPGEPFLASPIYQTEPRFCPPDSPPFFNAVIELAWSGTAAELHRKSQAIETSLGRTRNDLRNAPRVIDIDLLYVGEQITNTPTLDLPHPRIGERRFVLEPLAAIRPDLILPGSILPLTELLRLFASDEPPLVPITDTLL